MLSLLGLAQSDHIKRFLQNKLKKAYNLVLSYPNTLDLEYVWCTIIA